MDKRSSPNSGDGGSQGVVVQLRWQSSGNIPTIHATQLRVVHSEHQFYLVFGELDPVTMSEIDQDNPPEYLDVNPIAKIAVSPDLMPSFIEAMQTNLERYLRAFATGDEGGEQ